VARVLAMANRDITDLIKLHALIKSAYSQSTSSLNAYVRLSKTKRRKLSSEACNVSRENSSENHSSHIFFISS